MNDLTSRRRKGGAEVTPRTIVIGFLFLTIIGLIVVLILFAGSFTVEAGDMVHVDGKLITTVSSTNEEPTDVWVQHLIYRDNGIFSREKVGETYSVIQTLTNGENVLVCPAALGPGTYKIFIYISSADESQRRLAGITKTLVLA